jgi:hypothetical protein
MHRQASNQRPKTSPSTASLIPLYLHLHLARSPGKEKSPLEFMKTSECQGSKGLARNTY